MDNQELQLLGTLTGTYGVSGIILVDDVPEGLVFADNSEILIGFTDQSARKYCAVNLEEKTKGMYHLKIEGIDSKEDAALLKENGLFMNKATVKASNPDFIFPDELFGCEVFDEKDMSLIGVITEVWEMPANNVWLVETPKGDLPVPVIEDVIKKIYLENKKIVIHVLNGLMDLLSNTGADDED